MYSYRLAVQHPSKLFEVSSVCWDTFYDSFDQRTRKLSEAMQRCWSFLQRWEFAGVVLLLCSPCVGLVGEQNVMNHMRGRINPTAQLQPATHVRRWTREKNYSSESSTTLQCFVKYKFSGHTSQKIYPSRWRTLRTACLSDERRICNCTFNNIAQ
jgi:hypothetical protein